MVCPGAFAAIWARGMTGSTTSRDGGASLDESGSVAAAKEQAGRRGDAGRCDAHHGSDSTPDDRTGRNRRHARESGSGCRGRPLDAAFDSCTQIVGSVMAPRKSGAPVAVSEIQNRYGRSMTTRSVGTYAPEAIIPSPVAAAASVPLSSTLT